MKKILRTLPVIIAAIAIFAASTLSWLIVDNTVPFPTNFGGSTKTAYFAGGDGSNDDPYIIENPVHFYNLAWLQYLGYFNLGSYINNGRAQSFFKLDFDGDNLNLGGLALPPIGTREYPFIGYFNGNGKTISNFTVSNSKTDLIRKPLAAVFSGDVLYTTGTRTSVVAGSVDILGLFGVTGNFSSFLTDYDGKKVPVDGTDTAVEKHEKDSSGSLVELPDATAKIPANDFYYSGMNVRNFYVDKIRINSVSSSVLVGLAAGYVSSTVENVGVYRSKVTVKGDSLSGVSNVKRASGTAVSYDGVISNYSIVGDYDSEIVGWTEAPSSGGTSPGEDTVWGGSIDMRTLNRRLGYMFAQGNTRYSGGEEYSDSDFYNVHLLTSRGSSTEPEYYWGNVGILNMYMMDGTVIPLNVDKEKMLLDKLTTDDETEPSASNNYHHTHSKYDGVTPEVLRKNTGYLVGGNGYTVRAGIRLLTAKGAGSSARWYPGIFKSFDYSYSTEPSSVIAYDDEHKARFALFTKDANGNTYRIIDSVNKDYYSGNTKYTDKQSSEFNGYDNVRANFDETMTGSQTLHGVMFDNNSSGLFTKKDDTTGLYKTNASYTTVDGVELVKSCMNFTLQDQGYVTTILAAGISDGAHSLFDLYKVKRTDGKVDSITKINKLYTKSVDGEVVPCYEDVNGNIYSYDKTSKSDIAVTDTTGLTLSLDLNSLEKTNSLDASCAFYFEMLLSPGDYLIGKDHCWADSGSNTDNAYIMYLDIGANGSGSGGGGGETQTLPYIMQSVDFVAMPTNDSSDTLTVPTTGFPKYRDVGFKLGATADVIYFRREDYNSLPADDGEIETIVYYYRENNAILVTVFPTGYGEEDDGTNAKWE